MNYAYAISQLAYITSQLAYIKSQLASLRRSFTSETKILLFAMMLNKQIVTQAIGLQTGMRKKKVL